MASDSLSLDEIRERLNTKVLGLTIFVYDSLSSTNVTAKDLARKGSPEGTLVVAEEQRRGRGRFDRWWYSPKGFGIWLSLILRPNIDLERAPTLSVLAGLSVTEAIRKHTGLPVLMRWPNDVVFRGKKLCGVLTEVEPSFVILGIGINVNHTSFPPELLSVATSLRMELGRCLERVELLCLVLLELERNYFLFLKGGELKPLLGEIRELSSLIGKRVRVTTAEDQFPGEVIDIDEGGRLVLRLTSGRVVRHIAGEVTEVRSSKRKTFTS